MKKFKILSLDGGGVRGYLTTIILLNIEKVLNRDKKEYLPLGKYFDLIAGTSTGAIIAGLLAIGKSAKEIKKIYEENIKKIFSDKMKNFNINIKGIPIYGRAKYKKDNLEEMAKKYFGDKTFSKKDLVTNLLISTVDITTAKPRFYKSDYFSRNVGRKDEKLKDAIVASASAPAFFPVAKELEYSSYLVDGGVSVNNPSLVALIDGLEICKQNSIENKNIVLLSIGTGEMCEMPYNVEKLENTQIGWISENKAIIEILMTSQSKLAEFQTKFLCNTLEIKYKRINPKLGQKIALDEYKKIDILKNLGDIYKEDEKWILENLNVKNNSQNYNYYLQIF